ncbi:MAG: hypothetical protein ACJ75J_11720 [Cytophagaceae bacterium]
MKGVLFLLFFSLSLQPLCAQYVKPYYREDETSTKRNAEKKNRKYLEASKRKLLVVLEEEDPKQVRSLAGSDEKLERYRSLIRISNQLISELVPQHWRQNNCQVEFKKFSECLALKKAGSKDYFCLEFCSFRQMDDVSELLAFKDPAAARAAMLKSPGKFGKFEISLIEKFGKSAFYEFTTITPWPNELDFTIAIQQMNSIFLAKYSDPALSTAHYEGLIEEKHPYLSLRTLLVDSAQVNFSPGFHMDDLKENYPYAFRFSSAEEIQKVVKAKDTAFAYLAIIPNLNITGRDNSFNSTSGGGMAEAVKDYVYSYTHYLIDAGSTEALFFAKNQPRLLEKSGWQLNLTHILKLYNMKISK